MRNLTVALSSFLFYSIFFLVFYYYLVAKMLKDIEKKKQDHEAIDVSNDMLRKGLTMGMVLVVFVMLLAFLYIRKRKQVRAMKDAGLTYFATGELDCINPEVALGEQADLLPYNSEYEFPRENLTILSRLGEGAYGVVMKALATGIREPDEQTTVAVKMVKLQLDNDAMRALISELKIMIHLGQHLNVVNLLGAVTKNITKRQLMIIVEYCQFGNVRYFLLQNRTNFVNQVNGKTGKIDGSIKSNTLVGSSLAGGDPLDINLAGDNLNTDMSCSTNETNDANSTEMFTPTTITTTDLICWAAQIANGMEYLTSRKVLHGDLATRNILLCNANIVKICDFGLARSLYKYDNYKKKANEPLPCKWLALECIGGRVFSIYSDVWAYGIVLWELFSLSEVPYPGMDDAHELYNHLRYGNRLEKPLYATEAIYDIMLSCWNVKPDTRPLFKDLRCHFDAMLPSEITNHFIELNKPHLSMNVSKMERGDKDYFAEYAHRRELETSIDDSRAPEASSASYIPDQGIELNELQCIAAADGYRVEQFDGREMENARGPTVTGRAK